MVKTLLFYIHVSVFAETPYIPECHLSPALFLCRVPESSLCTLCPECRDHSSVPCGCSAAIPADLQRQEALHGKAHQSDLTEAVM